MRQNRLKLARILPEVGIFLQKHCLRTHTIFHLCCDGNGDGGGDGDSDGDGDGDDNGDGDGDGRLLECWDPGIQDPFFYYPPLPPA